VLLQAKIHPLGPQKTSFEAKMPPTPSKRTSFEDISLQALKAAAHMEASGDGDKADFVRQLLHEHRTGVLQLVQSSEDNDGRARNAVGSIGGESCKDETSLSECVSYKKEGYCPDKSWYWYPTWMRDNCAETCGYCDSIDNGPRRLRRINNSAIADELVYAKTGSSTPLCMQGIWWMDQRGVHLPIPEDPSYKQRGPAAADELVMTFGSDWYTGPYDPVTKCITVPLYTGIEGHWAFMDQGEGKNKDAFGSNLVRMTLDFCFIGSAANDQLCDVGSVLDIQVKVNMATMFEDLLEEQVISLIDLARPTLNLLGFTSGSGSWQYVPKWIVSMSMIKTSWGWDRKSTLGPGFLRPKLPNSALKLLGMLFPATAVDNLSEILDGHAERSTMHYPVFQVVDGKGNKTSHWDAFLKFANTNTNCTKSTLECPMNRGNGTSLVPVLAAWQPYPQANTTTK